MCSCLLLVYVGVFFCLFFFSCRRRHTRCALVTGVQTCALPISPWPSTPPWHARAALSTTTALRISLRLARVRSADASPPDDAGSPGNWRSPDRTDAARGCTPTCLHAGAPSRPALRPTPPRHLHRASVPATLATRPLCPAPRQRAG